VRRESGTGFGAARRACRDPIEAKRDVPLDIALPSG